MDTTHRFFGTRGQGGTLVAISVLVAACSSLIGVEELHEQPRPGTEEGGSAGTDVGKGGSGGSTGGSAGNAKGGSGGSADGGKGGASGNAGDSGASGSGGAAGLGGGEGGMPGSGGDAGAGVGGDSGNAGTTGESGNAGAGGTPPVLSTVTGHLMDFFRQPLPFVTLDVDGVETSTDADGNFVVENVDEEYDVTFLLEPDGRNLAWVYQGLTRRDPTLQAYLGLSQRWMVIDVLPENGAPTDAQVLSMCAGSAHGNTAIADIPAAGQTYVREDWYGPATITATAHALLWDFDSSTELPTNYVAYDTFPLPLDDTAPPMRPIVNIDISPDDLLEGPVSGTVTDTASTNRTNYAFVRFPSGGALGVVADDTGPNTFSYLVPNIPDSSVTLVAEDHNYGSGEYALAHIDGLTAGATDVALAIPMAVSLTAPPNETENVNPTTTFRFQNRQTDAAVFVVRMENYLSYDDLFIVTERTELTLPTVLRDGFVLRPGEVHHWSVETHGAIASVDAAAGPDGFLDAHSWAAYGEPPVGPRTSSGSYTFSGVREFTMAP